MKKALCIVLTMCMLASLGVMTASATSAAAPLSNPDWVITEIVPDNVGSLGHSGNEDPFEFIEIYNSSASPLNLYDYCVTYNGNVRTNEKFENIIVEITPIKAGDYLDGSTLPWTGQTNECSDLSNKPVNPDTCVVQPGEVVVLWVMYHEAYYAVYNSGKGLGVADFREFHDVPADVKVIAVDGGSNAAHGGHDKNFNVKNSATGTYGLALYSEALNAAANVEGSDYPVVYTESLELAAWATVDFTAQIPGHLTNQNIAYNFTFDKFGHGADEWYYKADSRRMVLCEIYADITAGRLTTYQKLTLGVALEAGETFDIDDMYAPVVDAGDFLGFEIGGTLYAPGSTFTASAAGVQTFDVSYGKAAETEADTTIADTTKSDDTTKAPDNDETTAVVPTGDDTTATPATTKPEDEGGCKSAVTIGLAAILLPAAIIVAKKKKD